LSQRNLSRLYREYNRKYFNNQLPTIEVDFLTPRTFATHKLGKRSCAVTLYENRKPFAIYIKRHPKKEWPYIKCDLLHEMIHVSLPYRINHGPRFKKELRRLMKAGAFDAIL
jgi:predicted metal-dependent hydrolase